MTPLRSVMDRVWNLPRRRRAFIDPFATLEVQLALGRLDGEIRRLLLGQDDGFARAHHLSAAVIAYGRALDEGCRMAGAALPEAGPALRRLLAEAELRSRGWDW